jgi:hydroxymethylpyrimidine pyrophosphatase-like HAD family hydrolase
MPVKLAALDVDGTLLRGGTVCQALARGHPDVLKFGYE